MGFKTADAIFKINKSKMDCVEKFNWLMGSELKPQLINGIWTYTEWTEKDSLNHSRQFDENAVIAWSCCKKNTIGRQLSEQ